MEWIQLITVIVANITMFLWARSEARNDQQEIRQSIRSDHETLRNLIDKHQHLTRDMIKAIKMEMTDFHQRLLNIESKKKNK